MCRKHVYSKYSSVYEIHINKLGYVIQIYDLFYFQSRCWEIFWLLGKLFKTYLEPWLKLKIEVHTFSDILFGWGSNHSTCLSLQIHHRKDRARLQRWNTRTSGLANIGMFIRPGSCYDCAKIADCARLQRWKGVPVKSTSSGMSKSWFAWNKKEENS